MSELESKHYLANGNESLPDAREAARLLVAARELLAEVADLHGRRRTMQFDDLGHS